VLDKKFIILCETAGDKSSVEAGSAAVSRVWSSVHSDKTSN
jgi:hypothetical protein